MTNQNNTLIIILVVVLALLLFGRFGFGMMSFGGGSYGLGFIFMVIAILCAVWVIYDVAVNNTRLSDGMKVLWIICAVLFSIITALIYYLVGRNRNNDLFRRR